MLKLRNIAKRFGGVQALTNVDLDVAKGELLGVIGRNGAGKTTLFNLIAGRFAPSSGTLMFENELIGDKPAYERALLGISRTFQIPEPLGRLNVFENVLAGAFAKIAGHKEASVAAWESLELCDLSKKAHAQVGELTTPDLKRLEVARALATRPKLLLLDEVMAGLRPAEVNEAMTLCRRIRDRGVTILFVEHVMYAVMNLCERVVVIDQGRVIANGTPAEIQTNETVIDTYLGRTSDA